MTEQHAFSGVIFTDNGYVGACSCGFKTEPTAKEDAWESVMQHFTSTPEYQLAVLTQLKEIEAWKILKHVMTRTF